MLFSNVDVFVIVLPILLWELAASLKAAPADESRTEMRALPVVLQFAALLLLSIKPQCGILIGLYLLWDSRHSWRALIGPLLASALVIATMSLIGAPLRSSFCVHSPCSLTGKWLKQGAAGEPLSSRARVF